MTPLNRYNPDNRRGWLLILPSLIFLVPVFIYPILQAFLSGFTTRNLRTRLQTVFSGWNNYSRLLEDGRFWQTLGNTFLFTISSVGIELALGLGVALILDRSFRGRDGVRTAALIPWALPTAVMGLGWAWIFNDRYGVINDILQKFGVNGINWLGEPTTAMIALIAADVWKTTPFITIILLAGLQAIPRDLYEAYRLDGANGWRSFYGITLPLLMPQIVIALIFRFAQAFGVFDLVQVMTGGGPAGSTETVALYIYTTIMRYLDFGYGSAMVVVTFGILVGLIGLIYLISSVKSDGSRLEP